MRQDPLVAIAHPTDFSEASAEAFAHALRLALEFRCRLDLLHVRSGDREWSSFPHVRETLARWELLPADVDHAQVQEKLGIDTRLLADFEPKGEVARAYGSYIDAAGIANRTLVLIDENGLVAWTHESPSPGEFPAADVLLGAVSA